MKPTAAPTRYALPPDVPAAIAAITKALVLPDGASDDDIRVAIEALFGADATLLPQNIEASGRRLGLSAREIAACCQRRCDPRRYMAIRDGLRRGAKSLPK